MDMLETRAIWLRMDKEIAKWLVVENHKLFCRPLRLQILCVPQLFVFPTSRPHAASPFRVQRRWRNSYMRDDMAHTMDIIMTVICLLLRHWEFSISSREIVLDSHMPSRMDGSNTRPRVKINKNRMWKK